MDESTSDRRAVDTTGASARGKPEVDAEFWNRETEWFEQVSAIAKGDEAALARLYDASSGLVYSLAVRIVTNPADAEEVALDVYTQVWREATRFDPARGTVFAWLMMLTRSRAIDRVRAKVARGCREQQTEAYSEPPDIADLPDRASELKQRDSVVRNALASLSIEQRETLELAFFGGLSHSEIAARLDQPLGTIKTRIRLGMMKLKDLLGPLARGPKGTP